MKGKTNAMRVLDRAKVEYNMIEYESRDGLVDGLSVSKKINRPVEDVFKTLVTQGTKEIYVFIVPVAEELDMKKAAKVSLEKKVEMVNVKDINKLTGYIRGGCSPIGMKKSYKTFIDRSAAERERIIISGGKIGSQIELELESLQAVVDLQVEDLVK